MEHTNLINSIEDFNIHLRAKYHYPEVYAQRYARATSCAASETTMCAAVACERDGIQQIRVLLSNGLTEKEHILTGGFPSMPCAAAAPDGSFRILYTDLQDERWHVMLASVFEDSYSAKEIFVSDKLCHQTALICTEKGICAAWSGIDKSGTFSIHLYREQTGEIRVIDEDSHCFRPALAAGGSRLYLAYDLLGKQQSAILRVMDGDGERRFCLASPLESYYSCSLAAKNEECGMAFIALRPAIDRDRDIADHSTAICFVRWNKVGLSAIEEAANLDEGLLGKRVYVPYFGVRRRCMLLSERDGYALYFEKRFEHEREDVKIDYDPHKLCYEHYGYLIRRRRTDTGWQNGMIAHESGSCYSLAGSEPVAAACLEQHNVYELPQLRLFRLSESDAISFDEMYENPNFSVETYEAEDRPRFTTEGQNLYWGDTHVHSLASPDAEGESDMLMRYARHVAKLDYVALVDNDYYPHTGLTPVDFARQKAIAHTLTENGKFVAIPAVEFTCHEKRLDPNFNHRYVLYFGDSDYCSRTFPNTRTVKELTAAMQDEKVIIVAHHPHWELSGTKEDSYVEIVSSWRVSMEEKNFILQALSRHQKFAFVGSSDTHRAVGGMGGALTGVYASELTSDALYEGYRSRHTIATQGHKIGIAFSAGGSFLGEEGSCSGAPDLNLKVSSPVPLEFIEIIRDGIVLRRYDAPAQEFTAELTDENVAVGEHFYYVRVKAIGEDAFNEPDSIRDQPSGPFIRTGRYPFNFARARGPYAWCSPVFLTVQ